jgi:hypothetical protein
VLELSSTPVYLQSLKLCQRTALHTGVGVGYVSHAPQGKCRERTVCALR